MVTIGIVLFNAIGVYGIIIKLMLFDKNSIEVSVIAIIVSFASIQK